MSEPPPTQRLLLLAAHGAILITLIGFTLDHIPLTGRLANLVAIGSAIALIGLAMAFYSISAKRASTQNALQAQSTGAFMLLAFLWMGMLLFPTFVSSGLTAVR